MSLAERLEQVRARIAAAAQSAGRSADNVGLIAVSKFQPAEAIREAYGAGQRDFGENYVQELCAKAEALSDLVDVRWHLIGHLQRNKAQKVVSVASSVQTVDSVELAGELGKRALSLQAARSERLGAGRALLDVLVEVNIAGEAQKSGVPKTALEPVLEAIEAQPALRLRGLLCVPPVTEDPDHARPFFDALVALRDRHGGVSRLPELSMGMTADLEPAIAAGATLVRIGTAIFGPRPARKE